VLMITETSHLRKSLNGNPTHGSVIAPQMRHTAKPGRLIKLPARPLRDVGRQLTIAREMAGLTQREVATRAKMRQAQVSRAEQGFNMEAKFYAKIALVLGYEGVMDLLHAVDPPTRKLLRIWNMADDAKRGELLRKLKVWFFE
jgi:transcriptional regulator with XRE-family HTH domain